MEPETLRRLRGAKDLLEDTVEAAAIAIGEAQHAMTRKPYALLARIEPIAAPVRAIEQAHLKITDGVYFAIRVGNRLAGKLMAAALDRVETTAASQKRN